MLSNIHALVVIDPRVIYECGLCVYIYVCMYQISKTGMDITLQRAAIWICI